MDNKPLEFNLGYVFGSRQQLGAFVCAFACLLWSILSANNCFAAAEADFRFTDVEEAARKLSEKPYKNSAYQVPDFLLSVTEKQWNKLSFNPDYSLWKNSGLPFEARFFHPGFIYNGMVSLYVIENGLSERIPFSTAMFDYGDTGLAEQVQRSNTDFAGFRLYFPLHSDTHKDEVTVFLGATFFRALGRHTDYGLDARGLALSTGLPEEEFPYFRKFWLVKPEADAASITVYALMDSPSVAGAFHFVITPGTSTVMDVSVKLFPRTGASHPLRLELAPINSMFLFSESGGTRADEDNRPEVHNSDGLLYTSEDRWFWRPLSNSGHLSVNKFQMVNPRGFGLIQRDDKVDHYQDISGSFARRPSLWVEPSGDWGAGKLELIEIPSLEEIHNNILVSWVPDDSSESAKLPLPYSYAYRLYWMAPNTAPHTLGRAVDTHIIRNGDITHFIIDFESVDLNALPADTGLSSVIETPEDNPVLEKQLSKNPHTGGWRLQFKVRLPRQEGVMQNLLSTAVTQPRLRFSALLKKGENLPDSLTETWIYDVPF